MKLIWNYMHWHSRLKNILWKDCQRCYFLLKYNIRYFYSCWKYGQPFFFVNFKVIYMLSNSIHWFIMFTLLMLNVFLFPYKRSSWQKCWTNNKIFSSRTFRLYFHFVKCLFSFFWYRIYQTFFIPPLALLKFAKF
jgi:hypothetical protein